MHRHGEFISMLLIEDVLDHMGELAWFIALDFQFGFWQILVAL